MANRTMIRYKLVTVRATLLNRCGVPIDGACSTLVDRCIISLEESPEYKDREEWFFENGDGDFCATVTTPPKKKWANVVLTFNDANPVMANFLTGSTILLDNDDSLTPNQIGYGDDYGSADLANVGIEIWTRIAAECDDLVACPDDGSEDFGYILYPWVKEGTIGDVTYENGLANFVVNAIAVRNSPWGVGPYSVYKSEATATIGQPVPLFSAVPATRFSQVSLTKLPPPNQAGCECQDLTPALEFADTGTGLHHGTVTLPLRNGVPIVPGYITWGDAGAAQLVTSGTSVLHNYAIAGSYAPTYKPSAESSATYTAVSTPIA